MPQQSRDPEVTYAFKREPLTKYLQRQVIITISWRFPMPSTAGPALVKFRTAPTGIGGEPSLASRFLTRPPAGQRELNLLIPLRLAASPITTSLIPWVEKPATEWRSAVSQV